MGDFTSISVLAIIYYNSIISFEKIMNYYIYIIILQIKRIVSASSLKNQQTKRYVRAFLYLTPVK